MDDHLDSFSSSSSDVSDSPVASTLSDLMEDATSSSSSSYSSLSLSSSSSDVHHQLLGGTSSSSNGPLYEMSSLIQQLPIKRGLSKHFQGKSQSFTSILSEVRCLEDLVKPENPYKKKKLKTCLDHHQRRSSTTDHHHHHHYINKLDGHNPNYSSPPPETYC